MNKIEVSPDETTLQIWTRDADSVFVLIGEAEDEGLRLDIASKREWFATKVTARVGEGAAVSAEDRFRLKSLARRIGHIGLRAAA